MKKLVTQHHWLSGAVFWAIGGVCLVGAVVLVAINSVYDGARYNNHPLLVILALGVISMGLGSLVSEASQGPETARLFRSLGLGLLALGLLLAGLPLLVVLLAD